MKTREKKADPALGVCPGCAKKKPLLVYFGDQGYEGKRCPACWRAAGKSPPTTRSLRARYSKNVRMLEKAT